MWRKISRKIRKVAKGDCFRFGEEWRVGDLEAPGGFKVGRLKVGAAVSEAAKTRNAEMPKTRNAGIGCFATELHGTARNFAVPCCSVLFCGSLPRNQAFIRRGGRRKDACWNAGRWGRTQPAPAKP